MRKTTFTLKPPSKKVIFSLLMLMLTFLMAQIVAAAVKQKCQVSPSDGLATFSCGLLSNAHHQYKDVAIKDKMKIVSALQNQSPPSNYRLLSHEKPEYLLLGNKCIEKKAHAPYMLTTYYLIGRSHLNIIRCDLPMLKRVLA